MNPASRPALPPAERWSVHDHRCQAPGCRAWGAWGFGVALLAGRAGRWFCGAHRGLGEPAAVAPEPDGVARANAVRPASQARLL